MDTGNVQLVADAFEGLVADVVSVMGPIGVAAVSIAAILLAFRYGRKILNAVAK